MKYRTVRFENCYGNAFYRVQYKPLLWPFWMTCRYMFHPDLPDPPYTFDTESEAMEFIKRQKGYKYKMVSKRGDNND